MIAFACPLATEGVSIDETWDAGGMRGTGSHDIVVDDVIVNEPQLIGRRAWGGLDRLQLDVAPRVPHHHATYLGVAEGLVDTVLGTGRVKARARAWSDSSTSTSGPWAGRSTACSRAGRRPRPVRGELPHAAADEAGRHGGGAEIADVATELAGGGAYARRGAVDRMTRDLRAPLYHPHPPEATLVTAGRARLGLPFDP